ncbi:BMP family ABC transporter substrate-binding protein [Planctomonas sp. JC2975]|uniref:BMP family ABC transporter substrate-binding protein n=1 Tax=Planctomonas sp. JC2975 TaxID=2729626 RepID=UPI001473C31B|nr:BMP family ABC transporter substrate-binding protein [Planctomonas sp. JC2975]
MTFKVRKVALAGLAAASALALLAGCGQAPSDNGSTTKAASKFLPCMVSDNGGFNDHSFNQLGYEGLVASAKKLGTTYKTAESKTASDYAPNINSMVDQNCNLIITVGFNLSDATKKAASANSSTNFAIIDDNEFTAPNVKSIIFDTAQAAFLGGYAAASFSKTGVVGTFGGMQIPTVTIFMDGFVDGVKYFNQQKGKNVQVVGWDVDSQKGSFTGGFDANDTAKQVAQGIIDQNADVIMPVGGPIYQSAAQAIDEANSSGKSISMIGVDADVYNTDKTVRPILLTSVMKGIKPSTSAVIEQSAAGKFSNSPYVGTLKNDGVGLAPFHDFSSKVDSNLKSELDTIKSGIIDGSIKVTSPASPKS